MAAEADFELIEEGGAPVLALRGDWTVDTIARVDAGLRDLADRLGGKASLDVAQLGRIDVAGAYLIDRTLRAGEGSGAPTLRGEHATAGRLLETARNATKPVAEPEAGLTGLNKFFERVGRFIVGIGDEALATFSFIGETLVVLLKLALNPRRIRWTSVFNVMEHAGLKALPIISLLSFFIGLVVAYLGARILGDFGAAVFTVELVAFSVMREFAIVITAVLLAGRTDSAFTAEIGAMKMRQEIDAMRVIGIDPMEALVAPRVIAMLLMTPVLAFSAVIAGMLGGFLVVWSELGVSPAMFLTRISDAVPVQHFWVGMSNAPVFAFMLAIVGCRHGLAVEGDVNSLGQRTTASGVQAIFLVILIDAIFALWFLEMDW